MDRTKNSMMVWFPKIQDLQVPKTEIVKLKHPKRCIEIIDNNFSVIDEQLGEFKEVAKKFGYPLFIRTDQLAAKHNWKRTCFVEKEDDLRHHIAELIFECLEADVMGILPMAIVFREYLKMDSKFKAFHGDMPVSPERRYFIKDGKIICHHPYWVSDAIEESSFKPSGYEWKEQLAEMNRETEEEISELSSIALEVTKRFEGYWSVDFCRGKDGKWWLIDMAQGEMSFHPPCDNKLTKNKQGA